MTDRECLEWAMMQLLECHGLLNAHGVGAKGHPLPGRVTLLVNEVIRLRGWDANNVHEAERQQARILELEDQLANADMIRRYLRQENLRLEKELFELMGDKVTEIDLEEAIDWMCEDIRGLDHPMDVCKVYELLTDKTWVPKFIDGRWVLEEKQK